MEPHRRMELVDTLLVEATQHIEVLQRAMTALEVAREERQNTVQGMPRSLEQYNLQAEKEWWEKAHHGLTIVRNAFEQIEQSEGQRGVTTKGSGG